MYRKKVKKPIVEEKKEKTTPAFLRPDYPYQAVGGELKPDECEDGEVFEIKCKECGMSIRTQGHNINATWERLQKSGCIGCGNNELRIYRVDMNKAPKG